MKKAITKISEEEIIVSRSGGDPEELLMLCEQDAEAIRKEINTGGGIRGQGLTWGKAFRGQENKKEGFY